MRTLRTTQPAPPAPRASGTLAPEPPLFGRGSPSGGASAALRLRVYLTRGRLDGQIASGRCLDGSAALMLRGRQLAHPHTRRQIARNLAHTVEYVDRNAGRRSFSAVVIAPAQVRAGRREILELAGRLEATGPVNPTGVALAQGLLTDGAGPLFNPHSDRTVAEAVDEVQVALERYPAAGHEALAA
jgi:hypothetical protein